MTNDDSEPPRAVIQAARHSGGSLPQVYRESNANMNQSQPSNPPETPTHPPDGTIDMCAPKPMTLLEKHQAALRHIHTVEAHNTKLYEDNCRLVNAVNMLNDRLAFVGAPQSVQVLRLADIQEKLRTSEANRGLINRKYQELVQCISAGSAHYHVGAELQAIRDAYASLDREYRLLGDNYTRLKTLTDTNRVAQQQSQGTASVSHVARGLIPVVRPEFRAHDQSRNNNTSPMSVISPGSFQPFLDQRGSHLRRSSQNIMSQPSLRPGTAPTTTTRSTPLPTPPPSASLAGGQIPPTGLLVHAPMLTGTLPLPHHGQLIYGSRTLSGPSAVTRPQHPTEQDASEQATATVPLHQPSGKITNTASIEPVLCDKRTPTQVPLKLSPRPLKRPNSELQTPTSPAGECKKPRIEEEADRPITISADTHPASKVLSLPASTNPHDNHMAVSSPEARSYQDCVNLIFEKDADIEHGVFCGLCLDRYEAKMTLEPPDVLIQPDFEFLVKHCISMHPTVWADLCR